MNLFDGRLPQRFWEKICVLPDSGCWEWTAATEREGYATITWNRRKRVAHRLAYEIAFGEPPNALQLDHVCHSVDEECAGGRSCAHRRCVNPLHLELVTPLENTRRSTRARKTHCSNGHEFNSENTYVWHGHRQCRPCNRAAARRLKTRKRSGGAR